MFFKKKLTYEMDKPFVNKERQTRFINCEIKNLEKHKRLNKRFYDYLRLEREDLDSLYFVRSSNQLELIIDEFYDCDIHFSTTHDYLAGRVIAYELLIEYFRKELHCLENANYHQYSEQTTFDTFNWTASKTDLIELIYALKCTRSVNGGDAQISQLCDALGNLFHVNLKNYYKTYSEIRNRTNNQTKFLEKLSDQLKTKIEQDDA